jgi:hypothetical protein
MAESTPRIRSLLRQADRVAESGKRSAAENLYRQIIEEAPDSASAWIGLASVVRDPAEQETAYEKALEIEPDNLVAQEGIDQIQEEQDADPVKDEPEKVEPEKAEQASSLSANSVEKVGDASPTIPAIFEADLSGGPDGDSMVIGGTSTIHDHSDLEVAEDTEVMFCANHPSRKTHLRCNKCGKPICSSCAQPTPVGYRCPQCIREHQDIYYTATPLDYLLVLLVTVPLSLLGGWLAMRLGFFTIFLGAGAGTLLGRIAFWVARRRRGRGMPQLVAAIVVIGGILPALPLLIFGGINLGLLWSGVYIFTATGAAYYQMR